MHAMAELANIRAAIRTRNATRRFQIKTTFAVRWSRVIPRHASKGASRRAIAPSPGAAPHTMPTTTLVKAAAACIPGATRMRNACSRDPITCADPACLADRKLVTCRARARRIVLWRMRALPSMPITIRVRKGFANTPGATRTASAWLPFRMAVTSVVEVLAHHASRLTPPSPTSHCVAMLRGEGGEER